ncbi:MAG: hypothetical protein AAF228_04560 [Pseudomonadota bacterium]
MRNLVENVSTQARRFYHLGCAKISRLNLSRMALLRGDPVSGKQVNKNQMALL